MKRRSLLRVWCLVLMFAAAGCGFTATSETHATNGPAGPGAGTTTTSGVRQPAIIHRGAGLSYARKVPLLIALEGAASVPLDMVYSTGFNKVADQRGFVVAYLATSYPSHAWSPNYTHDLQYVGAMITYLKRTQNIDPKRIYVTGFSAGGYEAWKVACTYSSEIAGIAIVSNAMNLKLYQRCRLSRPVSQYLAIGTANGTLYRGVRGRLPSAVQTTARWRAFDGCSSAPRVSVPQPGVVVQTTDSCIDGTSVALTVLAGGVHTWPSPANTRYAAVPVTDRYDASNAIWTFLSAHQLSPPALDGKLLSLTARGRAVAAKFRLGEPVKVLATLSRHGRVTTVKPILLAAGFSSGLRIRVAGKSTAGRYTVKFQILDPYGRRLAITRTLRVS